MGEKEEGRDEAVEIIAVHSSSYEWKNNNNNSNYDNTNNSNNNINNIVKVIKML